MARTTLAIATMFLLLLWVPGALAQDDTGPPIEERNITVDGGEPEESTFAGVSTSVAIVLIVLAVLVVALVVAMANRP